VGEYVHQLVRAWTASGSADQITLFTSSWKDRPAASVVRDLPGVRVSDHRVPVRILNFTWHNLEFPPVEWIARDSYDLVFSPHPLLLPSRAAAQVVMIHDLDFLRHPERTTREIRRDYPRLSAEHARRADRVIVPSTYTACEVRRVLRVPLSRISVCPPGPPDWSDPAAGFDPDGYLLFIGSLDPRKNVMGLLAAYGRLLRDGAPVPRLLLAGNCDTDAERCLTAIARPPFAGRVSHIGYIHESDRQRIYSGARALILPSFEEGFGMPALEAMSLGVPVIASDRGGLRDLVGDAGRLIDPEDERSLADALAEVSIDLDLARRLSERGRVRSREYSWPSTADAVQRACAETIRARRAAAIEELQLFRTPLTSRQTDRKP
jgi:glycosyltransferase involved in cell wall biosynthesis